ncbi:response regulator [Cohnella thailandensis]|uniref:Response regulator n=1 Tax=Cohnella thailandensis TaxID=557557 RepID=A0A841SXB9_9BACL|nr:helix-turn-helix domain-containing protein [Cohnella thailandensis]MBB6633391.1 response regulator [Cohnella thailandensis]MBP1977266.1 two-component system response regulator YesN [Cohnella thailandensis]
MTRLLIVDDEPFIVNGLKLSLDWERIGVSAVLTAHNARQAKEIFRADQVDIMLCDIEMPEESGLELLVWVKEHSLSTESVFLTCHADFAFARQAIELGSSDYILKPVPPEKLEAVILKVIDKIRKQNQLAEQSRSWVQHHPLFIERFWLDLVHLVIPPGESAVRQAIRERKMPYPADMKVWPVLIHVQRWHKKLQSRDEKILEYALKNAAEESIREWGSQAIVITLDGRKLLALIPVQPGSAPCPERLQTLFGAYIQSCRPYFYCDLSCYIGQATPVHEIASRTRQLLALQANNVSYDNRVFLQGASEEPRSTAPMPDMKVWYVMLTKGSKSQLIQEAERYLNSLANRSGFDAVSLGHFHQNFLQILFAFLQQKNIEARHLFGDSISAELSAQAPHSIPDMLDWVKHVTEKAIRQVQEIEQSHSVVEKACRYIDAHLDRELSREALAAQFYLNPDYMDRLFKKETGKSMKEYMWQERLRVAEELLAKTELPVTEIALQVGYSSISAFTRLFKKHTDLNPSEYRTKRTQSRSR